MTSKIFRSIFLTSIIAIAFSSAAFFIYSYSYYADQAKNELMTESEYVRAGIEKWGTDYLETVKESAPRISWISGTGEVIYDTAADGKTAFSEDVDSAFESGAGFSSGGGLFSEYTVNYSVRLSDGTVVRLSNEYKTMSSLFAGVIGTAILLFVIAGIIAFVFSKKMAKGIVDPINNIDLDNPEDAKVYPELMPIVNKLSSQKYKLSSQLSEMKMRENQFNSITKNMSEGMLVIDTRATLLSCNERAKKILAENIEIPTNALGFNLPDEFKAGISAALSGKNTEAAIVINGRYYSFTFTPVAHDRRIAGAVIFMIDETEKEQRDQLRREFTSNVSHELKTPLTSISGFAEIISSGLAEGEDVKRFADNIQKEAKRLINLVIDIIRITQLDGGEIPYDGPINLYAVAEDTLERLSSIANSSGITLSLEGEDAFVLGNRMILEEMIYNLSDNAIKYNVMNGTVKIVCKKTDNGVLLTVSDSGIGIPKQMQGRVFERFFRVDKSHSRNIGGTGLGLSIVKHAALYHKAEITLESEPGEGTLISVSFPGVESK